MPNDLKFGGQIKPTLKPTEWWIWLFLTATGPEKYKKMYAEEGLSRSTIFRTKKKLRKKGYL